MVDIILTEADPTHSAGYGGGPRLPTLTEENPTYFAEGGGGPQAVTLEETNPDYFAEGGGGLAAIELIDLRPLYPAPQVNTDPATEISSVSAVLNGILDDDGGMACECWFEWGLDTSYGNITSPISKTTGEKFSHILDGLIPETTYHFRALASNIFGISHGADREFRTTTELPQSYFNPALKLLLEEET